MLSQLLFYILNSDIACMAILIVLILDVIKVVRSLFKLSIKFLYKVM